VRKILAEDCLEVTNNLCGDPYAFFRDWLGLNVDKITQDQRRIIDAYLNHRYVAVTSGNGCGKTWVAAALTLHFLYTNPGSKVITTASTYSQVEQAMWPEIRAMHANAKRPLGGVVQMTKILPDPLKNPNWFAVGMSTNDPTSFQGRHAARVLVVIDEATGVQSEIFEAAFAMAIGPDDRVLALGNPTDAGSRFFEECEIPGKWHKLEVSGENHPNFLQRRQVIPGAISFEQIKSWEAEYGRDHPLFQARVLGRWSRSMGRMFPQLDDKVGGRHVYDPATIDIPSWYPRWAACDWGFSHNSSVLWAAYDGRCVYVFKEFVRAQLDSIELALMISELTHRKADNGRRIIVKLDAFYLSHDCFSKIDGPRSRADEMGTVLKKNDVPWPSRANKDRVTGISLIRTLLNSDRLKISKDCPKLIAGLKRALRNPDRPEDMLKEDASSGRGGDDEVDSLRYLLATDMRVADLPFEAQVEEATRKARQEGDYLTAMIRRMALEDRKKKADAPFRFGSPTRKVVKKR
jgi:hypothetical protein